MTVLVHNANAHPVLQFWRWAEVVRGRLFILAHGCEQRERLHSEKRVDSVEPGGCVASTDGAYETDVDLAKRAAGGDEEAFEQIVRLHQHEVSRRLRRFTSDANDHEELVQETFVQAFLGMSKYRGSAPLIHWLHRIAVRVGYRYWRARRASRAVVPIAWHDVAADSPRRALQLEDVLSRLAPRDRLVVSLLYIEDRSVEETALLIGWSRTMVKVQAFRARKRLRKMMEETGAYP